MMYGYFKENVHEREAVYDVFYRRTEGFGGYAIMAGLEQLIEFIRDLHFSAEDIAYLKLSVSLTMRNSSTICAISNSQARYMQCRKVL